MAVTPPPDLVFAPNPVDAPPSDVQRPSWQSDPAAYISSYLGSPVSINSGYRDLGHNAEVGGARGSAHTRRDPATGAALAYDVDTHDVPFLDAGHQLATSGMPFDQIEITPTHVHVSFDPRARGQVVYGGDYHGRYQPYVAPLNQQPAPGAFQPAAGFENAAYTTPGQGASLPVTGHPVATPPPDLITPPPDIAYAPGTKPAPAPTGSPEDVIGGPLRTGFMAGMRGFGRTGKAIGELVPGATSLYTLIQPHLADLNPALAPTKFLLDVVGQHANDPEQTTGAAAPIDWKGDFDPASVTNKILFGAAQSSPQIVGAVLGGPVGAGGVDAAQTFGVNYDRQKAAGHDNYGAAVRAARDTAIDAAATAIGWKLFAFTPFKHELGTITNNLTGEVAPIFKQTAGDMIKNLTIQGLGIQPAISVVATVAHNLIEGKSPLDNLPQAYATGALSNTIMLGAAHMLAPSGTPHIGDWRKSQGPWAAGPEAPAGAVEPEGPTSPRGPGAPPAQLPNTARTAGAPPQRPVAPRGGVPFAPETGIGLKMPDGSVQSATVDGYSDNGNVIHITHADGATRSYLTSEIQRDAVAAPEGPTGPYNPRYRGPQLTPDERAAPPLGEEVERPARQEAQPQLDPAATRSLGMAQRLEDAARDPDVPLSTEDRMGYLRQAARLRSSYGFQPGQEPPAGYRHPLAGEPAAGLGELAVGRVRQPDLYEPVRETHNVSQEDQNGVQHGPLDVREAESGAEVPGEGAGTGGRGQAPRPSTPEAVRALRQSEEPNAPSGLQPAAGRDVAVRGVPPNTPRGGEGTRAQPVSGVAQEPTSQQLSTAHDQAAAATEPSPSPAQIAAGNYRKGKITVSGIPISVETPRGVARRGTSPNGEPWENVNPLAHYGYINKTVGADGDHVDTYVGQHPDSKLAFVVDQIDPRTGDWDEHKAVLGARSQPEAEAIYDAGFSDGSGPDRRGAVTAMSVPEFRSWLKNGDTKSPLNPATDPDFASTAHDVRDARSTARTDPDLLTSIKDLGGIRVVDRDGRTTPEGQNVLEALQGHRRPGLINNTRNGMTPDHMREVLQEQGWFGHAEPRFGPNAMAAGNYPGDDLNDLYEMLDRSARGTRIFHPDSDAQGIIDRRRMLAEELNRAGVLSKDSIPEAVKKLMDFRRAEIEAMADEYQRQADRAVEEMSPGAQELVREYGYEPRSDFGAELEDEARDEEHPSAGDAEQAVESERAGSPESAQGAAETEAGARAAAEEPPFRTNPGAIAAEHEAEVSRLEAEGAAAATRMLPLATEPVDLGRGVTAEQTVLPGTERSAKQLAAAREAAGHGRTATKVEQRAPEGLFAERETPAADLFTSEPPSRTKPRPSETAGGARTPPRETAASIIQDAGEKIGGARKDQWAERGLRTSDLEDMSEGEAYQHVTKDQVWPKPDFAKMVEAGTDPVVAAQIKLIRDRLAARPRVDSAQGRRDYIEMMGHIRGELEGVKTRGELLSARDNILYKRLGFNAHPLGSPESRTTRDRLFSVFNGRHEHLAPQYGDQGKAEKMVRDGFPEKAPPWTRQYEVHVDHKGASFITKKGSRRMLEDGFESPEAASARAKALYEEGAAHGDEIAVPERPHLDKIERTGRDVRIGRNVGSTDFIKDFGFRGVEFGNWVAGDERQKAVNLAYDALHDMADVLHIPPETLSLGGKLGLAFGARGSGKFAAHYEPGKLVINLTKLSGAGSLAHEWGHALDHYFGTLDLPKGTKGKTIGASGWYEHTQSRARHLPNLRPEMAQAFDRLMDTLFHSDKERAVAVRDAELNLENMEAARARYAKQLAEHETRPAADQNRTYIKQARDYLTGLDRNIDAGKRRLADLRDEAKPYTPAKVESSYYGQAKALSGKSGEKGYWARPTEMLARAFEAYVFDKIKDAGNKSPYLVQGVEPERFEAGYKGNPYPTAKEREAINTAFDHLFKTVEVREREGRRILAQAARPFYSALTRAVEALGMNKASSEQWLGVIDNLRNKGVKQDEIDWSGVKDWLKDQKGPVTKEALTNFLRENEVQVNEVRRGGQGAPRDAMERISKWIDDKYGPSDVNAEVSSTDLEDAAHGDSQAISKLEELGVPGDLLKPIYDNIGEGATKFGQHRLPGGENYRELLMTLPERAPELPEGYTVKPFQDGFGVFGPDGEVAWGPTRGGALANAQPTLNRIVGQSPTFRSSHFDEPNILAHVRFDDRTGPNGEKILHMAEVQSDWAQSGRRKGFQEKHTELPEGWTIKENSQGNFGMFNQNGGRVGATFTDKADALRWLSREGVPDMPFKKTEAWAGMAAKRMLRYAAEHGYDKLSWDTGSTQEQRYWGNETVAPAVERWRQVTEPHSIGELAQNIFGRKMVSLMPLDVVDGGVLSALHHDQVRRAVIAALPVDVVDNLRAEKITPEQLFRKPDVTVANLSTDHLRRVANGILDATRKTAALLRTKLKGLETAGTNPDLLPALRASDLSAREVAGLLDPERLFHRGAGGNESGATAARPGTELARPVSTKLGSTALADALNHHAAIIHGDAGLLQHGFQTPPGEGQRGFYDKILPAFLNKYAKKWGAKVGTGEVPSTKPMTLRDAELARVVQEHNGRYSVVDRHGDPLAEFDTDAEAYDYRENLYSQGGKPQSTSAHSIAITPAMRESVMQGQPLFQKGAPRVGGNLPRSREARLDDFKELLAELPERATPQEQSVIDEIGRLAHQLAPHAEVFPARRLDIVPGGRGAGLRAGDTEVHGVTFTRGARRAMAVSLRSGKPAGSLRHEVVHYLKGEKFFSDKEWTGLEKAAHDGDWIGKHEIDARYPDLPYEGKLEEAVAEEFADWGDRKTTPEAPIRRLFARMQEWLNRVGRYLRSMFGKDATPEDIFDRINRGDVGRRPRPDEPEFEALKAQAARTPEGPPETPEEGRDYIDNTARDIGEAIRGKGPGTYARELQRLAPPSGPEVFLNANALQRHVMGPRTVAEIDTKSGVLWNAINRQDDEGHIRVNELRDIIADTFMKLPRGSQDRVSAVRELDCLDDLVRSDDGRSIVVTNNAHKYARGSKPGERIILSPNETKAYYALQRMDRKAWDNLMEGTARRLGWTRAWSPEMQDNLDAIRKASEEADHPRSRKAFGRLLTVMEGMDAQRRAAYMHLMRNGDYYISVKPKAGQPGAAEGGHPDTAWFELVERPAFSYADVDPLAMIRGNVTKTGETPAHVKPRLDDLRKQFPSDKYKIDHGYLLSKPDALRSLSIPAVEKLLMLMESGVLDRLKADLVATGAERNAARDEAARRYDGLYSDLVDAVQDEMYQQLTSGFKKRSHTIPGYSGDFNRALGSYMNWTSRHVARQIHGDEIERAYDDIQSSHPHQAIKDYWKKWKADDEQPMSPLSRAAMGLNQIGFLYTLAMNPASTMSILMHGPTYAIPTLSTGVGMGKAIKAFSGAFGEAVAAVSADTHQGLFVDLTKIGRTPEERRFIKKMADAGELHAKGADDVRSMAEKASALWGEYAPMVREAMDILSSNIAAADQLNRVATSLAAYRMARDGNLGVMNQTWSVNQVWRDLAQKEGVSPETMGKFLLTQGVGEWGSAARTEFGRTWFGRMGTALHGFQIRFLSNIAKQATRQGKAGRIAFAWTMVALWAAAGLQGLPSVQDTENGIDALWKALTGKDPMVGWRVRALLADTGFGPVGADLLLRGPLSILTGVDFSRRLGFGRIITDDVAPWFGGDESALTFPSIVAGALGGFERLSKSHQKAAAVGSLLPAAARHVVQAAAHAETGRKSQTGRTTYVPAKKFTDGDALREALGLTPLDVARAMEHAEYRRRASQAHMPVPRDTLPR